MYMKHIQKSGKTRIGGGGERGGLTIFTAVLVLIMMTLMLVYATRVSLYETRVSSNDVRQKEAFHVAEAAVDQGIMYLLANAAVVLSNREDVFPDDTTFTRDGWFSASGLRWQPCPATPAVTHPCGGDVSATTGSFYYDTDSDTATVETLAITDTDFPDGTTARMSALLCFVNLADPAATTCAGAPTTETEEAGSSLVLTLLAYGYSDCTDITDVGTCTGEATVALPISNYKKLSGSPAVPLTTKTLLPLQGTVEIVANPNAGGIGVPVSAWINTNPACGPATPITSSGSWQTCELQEWYHTDERPDGTTCTDNNCLCGFAPVDTKYYLSYKIGATTKVSIDIIVDPLFPCDLFEHYFGVPKNAYEQVKNQPATTILPDCSTLGPQSSGFIWISGPTCNIAGGTVVGSPSFPVVLISAATDTFLGGGVNIYGVLYVFDGEDASANLRALANATVYGAAIVDAELSQIGGTFQIVYSESVLANAAGIAGLGSVNGGWRDFGLPEVAWPVPAP